MKIIKSLISKDNKTIKYLQKTEDNNIIETGYYNLDEHIICISSQIGCDVGCVFCATTYPVDDININKNFIRNLSCEEIVQQVENVIEKINPTQLKSKRILFSYMGMGEPFLNYENVVNSIKILSKKFPESRTTISTIGLKPLLMKKLAHENINTLLKLHLSLHAPNNILRKKILPKSKDIKPALEALKYFSIKTKTIPKVNYVLIKHVNDSKKQAVQLAELLHNYPFFVKLSNLNKVNDLESTDINTFDMFEKILNSYNIKNCRFFSDGTDIKASCGQLRRYFYPK